MNTSRRLVVHVAYGPLRDVIDPARLAAIAGDVEVRTAAYDLSHSEHTRRAREPGAPDLADGEVELSADLRDALGTAEVMLTLNAPLKLQAPSRRPRPAILPSRRKKLSRRAHGKKRAG